MKKIPEIHCKNVGATSSRPKKEETKDEKNEKNKGITLIALVITIIVLLILAGVALSLVAGNEGILGKAETAVSQTNIAGAKEQAELLLAEVSADYYEKKFVDKTVSGSLADYIEGELSGGKTTSNGEFTVSIDGSGSVSVKDKNGNPVVSGTLDENGKIAWSESTGGNCSVVEIPEGLEVGDTVTYSPSGTYNWQAKYASSDLADDGTADIALATGSSVAEGSQDMSITSWKVLSIDQTTGKVQLVPSAPTTGEVTLQGPQGYNNAVKLLNDACSSLYGNSSKGISARSINIEDIEGVMDTDIVNSAKSSAGWVINEEGIYEPVQASSAETSYPTIYEQEILATIDGTTNTIGFGVSEQTELIGRTATGVLSGKASINGLINPTTSRQSYTTGYYMENSLFASALGTYADLLLPNGKDTYYGIASRAVSGNQFYIRTVYVGTLNSNYVYGGEGPYEWTYNLFPIISLNSNLISGNDIDGWKVK